MKWTLTSVLFMLFCPVVALAGPTGDLEKMIDYETTFGLAEEQKASSYSVYVLESNAPGHAFLPGEDPEFTIQIQNETNDKLSGTAEIEIMRYGQKGVPGVQWRPRIVKLEDVGSVPIDVKIEPGGWQNVTFEPKAPQTRGGYAMIMDFGDEGRHYLASFTRLFQPDPKRVPFPSQSLEHMPPAILERLGVKAIRFGIKFAPEGTRRREREDEYLAEKFPEFYEHKVMCTAEIGASGTGMPLDTGRAHLNENDVMKGGKRDLAWLPKHDDDYEQWVYEVACEYGWPNGPINGFMLWNEPWEGHSISGWQADMIRYRTLYKRMAKAVMRAREDAGVDVLIGGCDSSSNTWDKLFPDGSMEFLPYLDFCSIHYQGLSSPCLYPEWRNRTSYKGRVRIWDTESWVANTDDRFVGVVAANRAAGYDRSMGTLSRVAVSTLSHRRIAHDRVYTKESPDKKVKRPRPLESRPLAATYSAVQHFIGEREFGEILFKTGLPWVFTFEGLNDNPDDGTLVVCGDIGALFAKEGERKGLFKTVRSLKEVETKEELRRKLQNMSADDPGRAEVVEQLNRFQAFQGATLTIPAADAHFSLYDSYGNEIEQQGDNIVIPLDSRGFFLRADPDVRGSFTELVTRVKKAKIKGIEPVEMIAHDMKKPVDLGPEMQLRITSMLNRPVEGTLSVKLGSLKLEYPRKLSFEPRERKWVDVRVVGGTASPDNTYPLEASFATSAGTAVHYEDMHVNYIDHRSISVDGKLDDWRGVLPQPVSARGGDTRSLTEEMWLPFEESESGEEGGFATGYLAYDEDFFYFAAKIADSSRHPGTVRFATRDDDAAFYPKVSYKRGRDGKKEKLVWPEGVRRFSYRRSPVLPDGNMSNFDNVQIAFNAIPLESDHLVSHLPGRMPKFVRYKSTDYEYALNNVSEEHGGGTEIWRMLVPGMVRKHFYPRQPEHPLEGPVKNGKLEVRYEGDTRFVECAIPWSEIPRVKLRLDTDRPVKFAFRVNDNGGPSIELCEDRSVAEGLSYGFHPNWSSGAPTECAFGWEKD